MTELTGPGVKTLGIKLPAGLHAQFTLVAQLDDMSLADAALLAVEHYVKTKRAEPTFGARAKAALESIEREAQARQAAIQSLFGDDVPQAADGPPAKPALKSVGSKKAAPPDGAKG
ncbi:hypothetical protein [Fodinicola acaciae]|uniref:hypothetical protein n=1 Tax=Fodinicola acaciae TaxID=2681555 RepID=UPI001C9E4347|nr:hypothetical protein [Fodinicola acaciae]